MAETKPSKDSKALVTVFDDLNTAKLVVEEFHNAGFPVDKIELVTHNVKREAPEVTTPRVHETTATSMVDSAVKWGGAGATAGLLAAVFAPFPGVGLAMIFTGGLAGSVFGGIAGIQHAIDDDSVDLPSLDEYKDLVNTGDCLVVVLGNHEEIMKAEAIVQNMVHVRSHIHTLHGHQFHEHPSSWGDR